MAPEPIIAWLKQQRRAECLAALGWSAIELGGGLLVLALTFCFFLVPAKLVVILATHNLAASNWVSLAVALVVTALLIYDSLTTGRDDMSSLLLWMLREVFEIGPRALREGVHQMLVFRRFKNLDVPLVAEVLAFLAKKSTPFTRAELEPMLPGLSWKHLISQLALIPGVIVFRNDQNRVTLSMPLRLMLGAMLKSARRTQAAEAEPPPVEPVPEPAQLAPHEILGVTESATVAEIKTAYRTRVKECHPDLFAQMDEHSRHLAEEWTKALNAAYSLLLSQYPAS